ncbi:hypothetical protein [Parasphingorhabdus sp.]|uniref:hypothetical protein n=1 Tax=Parasphingorhabdus sp. TaxID=2709688 RepID=UPI003BAFD57C
MKTETTGPRFGRLNRLSEERSKKPKSPPRQKSTSPKTRSRTKRPTTPSQVRIQERQRIKDVFLSQEARDQPYTAAFLLVTTNSDADKLVASIPLFSLSREDAIAGMSAAKVAVKPKPSAAAQKASTDQHGWDGVHRELQAERAGQ